jgi:hypothetical protein
MNYINGGLVAMVSVIGKIVAPHGEDNFRREIFVGVKEYDKPPLDIYPITHVNKPEGIGVTLINGDHECEASFHRYEKGRFFYIGSASRRLRSLDCAKIFRRFLEKVGIVEKGALVKLEFDGYKINISKI